MTNLFWCFMEINRVIYVDMMIDLWWFMFSDIYVEGWEKEEEEKKHTYIIFLFSQKMLHDHCITFEKEVCFEE